MISRPTTSLSSITLTAREHEEMRNCITRLQRLGLKDNKAVNLINRMSMTLKKGARRADKNAGRKKAAEATLFREEELIEL